MNYYMIKLGLESAQAEIMASLQSNGAEVIQTSGGLCAKTVKSFSEVQEDLRSVISEGQLEQINKSHALQDQNVAKDVRAFLN